MDKKLTVFKVEYWLFLYGIRKQHGQKKKPKINGWKVYACPGPGVESVGKFPIIAREGWAQLEFTTGIKV